MGNTERNEITAYLETITFEDFSTLTDAEIDAALNPVAPVRVVTVTYFRKAA